ncbi:hypothetical protein ACNY9Y_004438 [Cronobacter dublinensis]
MHLTRSRNLIRGVSHELLHQYDELGNRTVTTLPDGREPGGFVRHPVTIKLIKVSDEFLEKYDFINRNKYDELVEIQLRNFVEKKQEFILSCTNNKNNDSVNDVSQGKWVDYD